MLIALLFTKSLDKLQAKTYFRLAVYVGNRITANRPERFGVLFQDSLLM